jgi:hypothetical protein
MAQCEVYSVAADGLFCYETLNGRTTAEEQLCAHCACVISDLASVYEFSLIETS